MTKEPVLGSWDAVACPCGSQAQPRELFRTPSRRYVQCPACSLVFLSPRRSPELVTAFYREDYDRSYGRAEAGADRTPVFRSVLRHLSKVRRPPGRLLDVGCGDGLFLELCMKEGWTGFGVELSREAAARAAARGITMLAPDWLDRRGGSSNEAEHYDVIALVNVLETVTDPRSALRRVREALTPAGLVLIRVSNGSFHLSLRRVVAWAGARYLQAFHLFVYTPGALGGLLRSVGLVPVSVRNSSPSWAPLTGSERTLKRWVWRSAGLTLWTSAEAVFRLTLGRAVWAPSFEVIARVDERAA